MISEEVVSSLPSPFPGSFLDSVRVCVYVYVCECDSYVTSLLVDPFLKCFIEGNTLKVSLLIISHYTVYMYTEVFIVVLFLVTW